MAARRQVEFPIQPDIICAVRRFFHSQLFATPPYPTDILHFTTVIVTGANTGIGLEAARHFYRLGVEKLILAVRTVSKGQAAKENIRRSIRYRLPADPDAIEVWQLDQSSTASTLAFAERVKRELRSVHIVVLNAGINNDTFQLSEGYEKVTQVNVLNTFLLALLLKLNESRIKFPWSEPHLTIVTSEAHRLTKFEEINAPNLYEKLNDEKI
ncbi:hypothetical protein VTK56DRAFT_4398 [Thermocarpiscus australiensis]